MTNVRVIPPREKEPTVLRVTAYCRVSSDSSDQLHSYAAQIRGYTEEIRKHENWTLVDVYADEGLTGTRMDKREDFNRMLSDCRKGKIDKILYLKCGTCEKQFKILDSDMLSQISKQMAERDSSNSENYIPSSEAVRLTNAINRGLERPEQPEDREADPPRRLRPL